MPDVKCWWESINTFKISRLSKTEHLYLQQLRKSEHVPLFLGREIPQTFFNSSWISVLEYLTELFLIFSTVWNLLPWIISPQDPQRDECEVLLCIFYPISKLFFCVFFFLLEGKKATKMSHDLFHDCCFPDALEIIFKIPTVYFILPKTLFRNKHSMWTWNG